MALTKPQIQQIMQIMQIKQIKQMSWCVLSSLAAGTDTR